MNRPSERYPPLDPKETLFTSKPSLLGFDIHLLDDRAGRIYLQHLWGRFGLRLRPFAFCAFISFTNLPSQRVRPFSSAWKLSSPRSFGNFLDLAAQRVGDARAIDYQSWDEERRSSKASSTTVRFAALRLLTTTTGPGSAVSANVAASVRFSSIPSASTTPPTRIWIQQPRRRRRPLTLSNTFSLTNIIDING